jgi:hypothetical protein
VSEVAAKPQLLLLAVQRLERMQSTCSVRRNRNGDESYDRQRDGYAREDSDVSRFNTKQHRAQETSQEVRGRQSDNSAYDDR